MLWLRGSHSALAWPGWREAVSMINDMSVLAVRCGVGGGSTQVDGSSCCATLRG